MKYPEDKALIDRLIVGDEQAYKELVEKHQGAMRAVVVAIAGSTHIDDIVQDSWVSLVKNISSFQGRSSLKTWLLAITANTAKTSFKKKQNELSLEVLSAYKTNPDILFAEDGHWVSAIKSYEGYHSDAPEMLLISTELQQCFDNALDKMPELQSSVLRLREQHGLDLEDICDLLDISLSNVRVLLHRARLKLFSALEHFEVTGQWG